MTLSLDASAALGPSPEQPTSLPPDAADAYACFVAERAQGLKRYAYLLTGNSADADDLVQSALLKAFLAWGRLPTWAAADAYCRTIIGRACIRVWARRKRVRLGDVPERTIRPDESALEADVVWDALAALGPRQRAVVVLRFYDDLSEAAIADRLGVSLGTVKSQLSRARAHLRAALDDKEPR